MLHNKHGLCHCVMSICLSHLCILLKQINISSNFFSPLGSYTFLIFPYQRLWDDHCWRLKSSASKTISSVFHLHNTSATCELSVYLDGQCLRHECHPTYLGVTLDCSQLYAVLQRTLDEGCRQSEEPKQLADEASRFHLGRQRQHSAVICSGALLFSSTLSYREHLTKTAGKLKNGNNLLMKLAGSTWGASANTLRSSALALCYSAARCLTENT